MEIVMHLQLLDAEAGLCETLMCLCVFCRHHNKIRTIDGSQIGELVSLVTLDLSNNDITELGAKSFPAGLQIKDL